MISFFVISFFVPGLPKPAGSKRAFVIPGKNGARPRATIVDACAKSRDWKTDVSRQARAAYSGEPLTGPLTLKVVFRLPRPQSHYTANNRDKGLKDTAPYLHTSRPDATKLLRGLEDALTGICWADDAQICVQEVQKIYADDAPGAKVEITKMVTVHPKS